MSDIKQFIIDWNKQQSDSFSSPDARLRRQQFRAKHPTGIAAFKCMDGRLNMSVITDTPPGIIQPFRNMGGRFDLGWPYFGEEVKDYVNYSVNKGGDVLFLITYHFSKSDNKLGCAGFNYDTEAACSCSTLLRDQVEKVFGKNSRVVYPILVGIETDDDSLIFHSMDGKVFSVLDNLNISDDDLINYIEKLYPDMRFHAKCDLLRLINGNVRHVKSVLAQKRSPIKLNHCEQVIAVGRGFDWLHLPNKALIIGPYDGWQKAVKIAGDIVLKNIQEKRIDGNEGILLFISALSRDKIGSAGWNISIEKAKYMKRIAEEVLHSEVPEITPFLNSLAGVVDANTRLLHQVTEF